MSEQRIVLDTHIWFWVLDQPDSLPETIIARINRATREKQVLIAAISLWEISLLAYKKRIFFKEDVVSWLKKALSHPGILLCPLTAEVAAESYTLPGDFHGDPADRMIVATARNENALLLTRDEEILRYARDGYAKVLAA